MFLEHSNHCNQPINRRDSENITIQWTCEHGTYNWTIDCLIDRIWHINWTLIVDWSNTIYKGTIDCLIDRILLHLTRMRLRTAFHVCLNAKWLFKRDCFSRYFWLNCTLVCDKTLIQLLEFQKHTPSSHVYNVHQIRVGFYWSGSHVANAGVTDSTTPSPVVATVSQLLKSHEKAHTRTMHRRTRPSPPKIHHHCPFSPPNEKTHRHFPLDRAVQTQGNKPTDVTRFVRFAWFPKRELLLIVWHFLQIYFYFETLHFP